MGESGLSQRRIVSMLTQSPHGDLSAYTDIGTQAAAQDPSFFAHLVAWNEAKGSVRDAKVALPVLALTCLDLQPQWAENALAHVARQRPRELVRALDYARDVRPVGRRRQLDRLTRRYLRDLEAGNGRWDRTALLHREALSTLYIRAHQKGSARARAVLFDGATPPRSVWARVAALKTAAAGEVATHIEQGTLPFLVIAGALGARLKEPEVLAAVIGAMTGPEVATNMKRLERLGVKDHAITRAALERRLAKAATEKAGRRGGTMKTARAAAAVSDPKLAARVKAVQEQQLDQLRIPGDWVLLVDKSPSMASAIAVGREVAAILARAVQGKTRVVFFDGAAWGVDVTGHTHAEIQAVFAGVSAGGEGTSSGAGLACAVDQWRDEIDGVLIVTDAYDNRVPRLADVYHRWSGQREDPAPVYVLQLAQDDERYQLHRDVKYSWEIWHPVMSLERAGFPVEHMDLTQGVDYHSLPSLIATIKPSHYALGNEIWETPLLRLNDVLSRTTLMEV